MLGPSPQTARALFGAMLAVGATGCGPGLSIRAHGAVPIAAPGTGAATSAAREVAESAAVGGWGTDVNDQHEQEGELQGIVEADAPALEATPPQLHAGAPLASRYASLDRSSCEAELDRRGVAFERVDEARGVVAPLRLRGTIAGIDFHSMLPLAQRRTSPYEIYDCRLVLALDDWARVLSRHDIVEVVHYSVYRPPPAKRTLRGPGRRHTGALAIDAAIFKTRDGQTISVEKDFHGRIGSKPCGARAAPTSGLPTPAVTLRNIVCEAADAQLFNVVLTPDYNWPHRNHFHLEVTAGARWVFVR